MPTLHRVTRASFCRRGLPGGEKPAGHVPGADAIHPRVICSVKITIYDEWAIQQSSDASIASVATWPGAWPPAANPARMFFTSVTVVCSTAASHSNPTAENLASAHASNLSFPRPARPPRSSNSFRNYLSSSIRQIFPPPFHRAFVSGRLSQSRRRDA